MQNADVEPTDRPGCGSSPAKTEGKLSKARDRLGSEHRFVGQELNDNEVYSGKLVATLKRPTRAQCRAQRIISLLRAPRRPENRLFGLGQRHAADGSLADAAEIQRAFMLDDIGDLGEALRGRVLQVAHDLAV